MLAGPIEFRVAVSPVEDDPDLAVATITAQRTDGGPLENAHVFVQPADLVIDHGDGIVNVSLSKDEIRQGLGCMAIRLKDRNGQPVAEASLVATVGKDGAITARLEKRSA